MKTKNLTDNLQDLPKWAQSEVSVLQMRLHEAKAEIFRLYDNPKSNTILGWNSTVDQEHIKYLKQNQTITFCLPNGDLTVRVKDESLEVSSSGFSDGDLYVKPQVSNIIKIHLIK